MSLFRLKISPFVMEEPCLYSVIGSLRQQVNIVTTVIHGLAARFRRHPARGWLGSRYLPHSPPRTARPYVHGTVCAVVENK